MTHETIKIGSVVKMAFSTYESEIQKGWEVVNRYTIGESIFVDYVAECEVCNVTDKFFQVIIPHTQTKSVRMSKKCFTDTKFSYADMYGFKPQIVKI
jgi:hypothetical protein